MQEEPENPHLSTRFISAEQLAAQLGVSIGTIRRWILRGLLPPGKILGRTRLWEANALAAALRAKHGQEGHP